MLVSLSSPRDILHTHFATSRLPYFRKSKRVTCKSPSPSPQTPTTTTTIHPSSPIQRREYVRESSYDSTNSSKSSSPSSSSSQTQPSTTIHQRRSASRANTPTLPPSLDGFAELFHARVSSPFVSPIASEEGDASDAKRWQAMLRMQRNYHCYRSARLEAAVEALERGENPPIPSKLCLDLLNEELKAQMEAARKPH